MATTAFVSKVTRIARAWLQDVNDVVYNDLGGVGGIGASSGSSLVGFLQSGSGAVASTVQTELRYFVRPEQFGAIGDGITNDRAAVVAAFDKLKAAGGGVLCADNVYLIGSKITLDEMPPVVVKGAAGLPRVVSTQGNTYPVSCFKNGTSGGVMFEILGTVTAGEVTTAGIEFHNCAFDNTANANNIAFDLQEGYDRAYFNTCSFQGGLNAFTFGGGGTFNAKWDNCWFFSITKAFDFPSGANDFLNMEWDSCVYRDCGYAVYALEGNSFYFKNNLVETCTNDGYYLTGVFNIHIDGDHFEQNTRDIFIDAFGGNQPKMLTIDKATHSKDSGYTNNMVLVNDCAYSTVRGVVTINSGGPSDADYKWNTAGGRVVEIDPNCSFANAPSVTTGTEYSRSSGTWSPSITSLTVVGAAPTVSGRYVKVGPVVYFFIQITPAGADTTASTAGTTYSDLPFTPMQSPFPWFGNCQAVDNSLNGGAGGVLGDGWVRGSGVNTCHFPTWAATNGRVTISGFYMVAFS